MSGFRYLSRRDVLFSLATVGLVASLSPKIRLYLQSLAEAGDFERQGSTLIGGKFKLDDSIGGTDFYPHEKAQDNYVFKWDIPGNKFLQKKNSVASHYCQPHPLDRSLVACPSRFSNRMSLFSWDSESEIAAFNLQGNNYFYGHTVFTPDGTLMLATAIKENGGVLHLFEIPSLKLKDTVSLGPYTCHDIVMISPTRYLMGLTPINSKNTGAAFFGVYDSATNKIEIFNRRYNSKVGKLSVNHLHKIGSRVFATSNLLSHQGMTAGHLLSFNTETNAIDSHFEIGRLNIPVEILNIQYDGETGFVWLSMPLNKNVIVWDLKSEKLIADISFEKKQLSLALVQAIDAVVIGAKNSFFAYDRRTTKRLTSLEEKWAKDSLGGYMTAHTRII